eukprot:747096-Hanusia_phi.AAC.6
MSLRWLQTDRPCSQNYIFNLDSWPSAYLAAMRTSNLFACSPITLLLRNDSRLPTPSIAQRTSCEPISLFFSTPHTSPSFSLFVHGYASIIPKLKATIPRPGPSYQVDSLFLPSACLCHRSSATLCVTDVAPTSAGSVRSGKHHPRLLALPLTKSSVQRSKPWGRVRREGVGCTTTSGRKG